MNPSQNGVPPSSPGAVKPETSKTQAGPLSPSLPTMRARLVVFPIKGRNWCFTRSVDAASRADTSSPPPAWKDLCRRITSSPRPAPQKAEIVVDFVADKMNRAWIGLEKAPEGTVKSKIHSLGVKLLSRVKPSEIFLKSVTKDVTKVEVTYPASLNPRLVRRRLRHIALRGSAIHKNYFYGSISLIPLSSAFMVLPLPNIPFFWILFRAYSHWRAHKGSERLLLLVSDCPKSWSSLVNKNHDKTTSESDSDETPESAHSPPWVLKPSEDLEKLLAAEELEVGIAKICEMYNLEKNDVLKYKESV